MSTTEEPKSQHHRSGKKLGHLQGQTSKHSGSPISEVEVASKYPFCIGTHSGHQHFPLH